MMERNPDTFTYKTLILKQLKILKAYLPYPNFSKPCDRKQTLLGLSKNNTLNKYFSFFTNKMFRKNKKIINLTMGR